MNIDKLNILLEPCGAAGTRSGGSEEVHVQEVHQLPPLAIREVTDGNKLYACILNHSSS